MGSSPGEITALLSRARNGDSRAADELMPAVYTELRSLAARYLKDERPDHTLQATALVHEAYVRLVGSGDHEWQSRAHFFRVAARANRQSRSTVREVTSSTRLVSSRVSPTKNRISTI